MFYEVLKMLWKQMPHAMNVWKINNRWHTGKRLRDYDKKRQKTNGKKSSIFYVIYQARNMLSLSTFFFLKGRNMGYKCSPKHLVCYSINFRAIWAQTSSLCNFFCPRGSHIYEMLENYFQVSIFRIFSLFLRKIVQNTKKIKNQNGLIT